MTVFRRSLGRTAALAGGLAAFAPDADVFIRSVHDPLLAIEHHRGFTHALAFVPVGAAIVAALWLPRAAWRVPARWFVLWACCAVGYLSHPLLDAATTYGTQLLWPFSSHRASWDVISIIDPPFTLVLLVGLIVSLSRDSKRPSVIALTACAGYVVFGIAQHARAVAAQRQLAESRGHVVERSAVMPTLANNVVWRALYVHEGRIFSDRIRVGWFSAATVRVGWSLPEIREGDLTASERARNEHASFERFAWFSDRWVARSPLDASVLADMRYSLSAEAFDPIWGIRFTTGGAATEVEWINRSRERKIALGELWAEIVGRDQRFVPLPVSRAADRR